MKSRHAAALALIVLASCGPGMATINDANERAERAAERAQAAQLRAERSAALAADAVEQDEVGGLLSCILATAPPHSARVPPNGGR